MSLFWIVLLALIAFVIVQELDELIFCDEEMTIDEAIEKGILTEIRS